MEAAGAWVCPPCRGLCNCSFHRIRAGWAPTGTLYRRAIAEVCAQYTPTGALHAIRVLSAICVLPCSHMALTAALVGRCHARAAACGLAVHIVISICSSCADITDALSQGYKSVAHYLVLTKLATAAAADAALAADAQPAAAAPDQAPTADAAGVLIINLRTTTMWARCLWAAAIREDVAWETP